MRVNVTVGGHHQGVHFQLWGADDIFRGAHRLNRTGTLFLSPTSVSELFDLLVLLGVVGFLFIVRLGAISITLKHTGEGFSLYVYIVFLIQLKVLVLKKIHSLGLEVH